LGLVFTACGAAGVLGVNLWLTRDVDFGAHLLVRTATATSVAVVATCIAAGTTVWRATRGGVRAWGLLRVGVAVATCVYLGRWLGTPGRALTVVYAAMLAGIYVVILVLVRELKLGDWQTFR